MGNTASTARKEAPPNRKLVVKPPEDWNADTEAKKFVVVSPQSDISNPSQIRHPHQRSKMKTMTSKTPMRKRSSEVVAKQVPPALMSHNMATDLPAPESFYFDATPTDNEASKQETGGRRGIHQAMKVKATRARQILKSCWKEQAQAFEGCVRNNDPRPVEHQRFQSMSPSYPNRPSMQSRRTAPNVGKFQGPQFIPEVEEEPNNTGAISPRQVYLHDEEQYMNRIQDHRETPMMLKTPNINDDQQRPSESVVQSSPVINLFDRRAFSADQEQQHTASQHFVGRHSYPESKVSEMPKTVHSTDGYTPREPNSVEKDIQRQVDEQIRLQFTSKSEEIGRVKRMRESYLQKLEATKRLSQEESFRRQMIESKMDIMRERVIAEEFQTSTIAIKPDAPIPFDEPREEQQKKQEPLGTQDSLTCDEPLKNSTSNFAKGTICRGRSSAPVPQSTNAFAAVTGGKRPPKRQSAPVGKPEVSQATAKANSGNNLPVLLKIAGWEEAMVSTTTNSQPAQAKKNSDLPAILKLAGWKQPAKAKENKSNPPVESRANKTSAVRNVKPSENGQPTSSSEYPADELVATDENTTIPMPSNLRTSTDCEHIKETPVVKKMSRMLLATQSFVPSDSVSSRDPYGIPAAYSTMDDSIDSEATPMNETPARPMVAPDALMNAAFLFSPSYVDHNPTLLRLCQQRQSEGSTTITTLDSRHRLVPSCSSRAATVSIVSQSDSGRSSFASTTSSKPRIGDYMNPSMSSAANATIKRLPSVETKSSNGPDRHVRFSMHNDVFRPAENSCAPTKSPLRSDNLVVPDIEHKVSDLTDIFGTTGEERSPSTGSEPLISKQTLEPPSKNDSPTVKEIEKDFVEPSPPSNWSYTTDADNGVTPLRSGRNVTKAGSKSNKTNSPHKRFNEAKSRFSTGKVSPIKKKSPVKSRPTVGIVRARVSAMEQLNQKVSSIGTKSRRDTSAYKAIAPRRTVLKSPHFNKTAPQNTIVTETSADATRGRDSIGASSNSSREGLASTKYCSIETSEFSNRGAIPSMSLANNTSRPRNLSEDDSDSDSDTFGAIRKSKSTDEQDVHRTANQVVNHLVMAHNQTIQVANTSASTEIEDDDFAAMLHFQSSVDEEDESIGEEDTISTLQRRRFSNGSSTIMSGSTAPTVVRRSSIMTGSTAPTVVRRSSIMTGSTAPTIVRRSSVATGPKVRQVQTTLGEENEPQTEVIGRPSWSSYPPQKNLPFRDHALVRPTEQNHRPAPGQAVLSSVQRMPMQALKWKTLAAQESVKNKSSSADPGRAPLRRSDPNVVGY